MLEQKNQGRAKFKLAVFCVIGVHVVGLMALLLTQGCKREQVPPTGDVQPPLGDVNTNLPTMDNYSNDVALASSNAVVPTTAIPEPPPYSTSTATEHVIVKGDTFYDLAKKYGVTMQALKDANPTVNPSKLQLNQKIVIPAPTAPPPAGAAPVTTQTATGETTYKVVSGDNLIKIGAKFGVTVSAIRSANNLTSDRIVVGQVLKIPAKSAPPQ